MKLEEAVETLNKYKHSFLDVSDHHTIEWVIEDDCAQLIRYITQYKDHEACRGQRDYQTFTEFEAVAVAEKYEGDQAKEWCAEALNRAPAENEAMERPRLAEPFLGGLQLMKELRENPTGEIAQELQELLNDVGTLRLR